MTQKQAERAVDLVLDTLTEHKGFFTWWSKVAPSDQDTIRRVAGIVLAEDETFDALGRGRRKGEAVV